jgi:hypothetical protein
VLAYRWGTGSGPSWVVLSAALTGCVWGRLLAGARGCGWAGPSGTWTGSAQGKGTDVRFHGTAQCQVIGQLTCVGLRVGQTVGRPVGSMVGNLVGSSVGIFVGEFVGMGVGPRLHGELTQKVSIVRPSMIL